MSEISNHLAFEKWKTDLGGKDPYLIVQNCLLTQWVLAMAEYQDQENMPDLKDVLIGPDDLLPSKEAFANHCSALHQMPDQEAKDFRGWLEHTFIMRYAVVLRMTHEANPDIQSMHETWGNYLNRTAFHTRQLRYFLGNTLNGQNYVPLDYTLKAVKPDQQIDGNGVRFEERFPYVNDDRSLDYYHQYAETQEVFIPRVPQPERRAA